MSVITLERIVNNIDSLPPLSDIAQLVGNIYSAEYDDSNIIKLVRIIESDALLTANILKMINSAYYGFTHKISSISQAVVLFGTHKIYGLVISYAIQESIKANTDIYGLNSIQFNQMCHLQSSLILQWYSKISQRDAQFLSSLALMMESGKLILAHEVELSAYSDIFRKSFIECSDIGEYEKSLMEVNSYYLSALLFEHWNLEPIYIEVLKSLDNDHESDCKTKEFIYIIKAVTTAINLKEILTEDSIYKASMIVNDMNLGVDEFVSVAHRVRENYIHASK